MSNDSQIIHVSIKDDDDTSCGVVVHLKELSASLKTLRESDDMTDATLIVEEKRFPVHRVILAARCEYFRALFYGGMCESKKADELEIELKETPAEAFSHLLRYIYDGQITLSSLSCQTVLELVALANRFNLSALQVSVCNYLIGNLTVTNVCSTLDMAIFFQLERLHRNCLRFIDVNAIVILKSTSFQQLSREALIEVLQRDSFFAPEEDIFLAVAGWCKSNVEQYQVCLESPTEELGDVAAASSRDGTSTNPSNPSNPSRSLSSSGGSSTCSTDVFLDVLACVRLALMPVKSMFGIVRQSKLFSDTFLLSSMEDRLLKPDVERHHRGKLTVDKPLLEATGAATEIMSHALPSEAERDKCAGITVALPAPHVVNCISLSLPSKANHYGYRVYVGVAAPDGVDGGGNGEVRYRLVHDYSAYHCQGQQDIYIAPCVVRYIRVVGVYATDPARKFQLQRINAMFASKTEEFRDGFKVPKDNVALVEKHAVVLEGVSRIRHSILDGHFQDYDWDSGYTCHQIDHGCIIISLPQPIYASTMRLLLWDCDDRHYSYYIEVSLDNATYHRVADRTNKLCRSWQTISFNLQLVSYIKIVGTRNTSNEVFHCVHFECPASRGTESLALACEGSEQDLPAVDMVVEAV